MGLMREACSMTPQSQETSTPQPQGTSTPQPQAMAVTTDAKQALAQLQAQSKARQTDDYYYQYYYAALKLIIVILNMIKPNSHYSRGQKEHSNQPGLDMPNKEKPDTAAQPQGGAFLYKVAEKTARYARAYTVDPLKLLKVLMENLDILDKIKSYFSRDHVLLFIQV